MAATFNDLVSQITGNLGGNQTLSLGGSATSFTQVGVGGVDSKFYPAVKLDATNWDQLIPYRFVVIDTKNGNAVVGGGAGGNASAQIQQEKGSTLVKFTPIQGQWEFILPITPQQLSIVDQYAITTSATLRGVLEEHNGLKFKTINISSTMGVWPYRPTVNSPSTASGILGSIFAGTISAAQSFGDQLSAVISTATTGHPASAPNSTGPAGGLYTGYYLAQAFQQFLEQYAEAKKNPVNSGWRLVLDIPKQNQSFVVTPVQFAWQQSEAKPQLVNYNLQLKAWRRIDLHTSVKITSNDFSLTPNILQQILNTVTQARMLMSSATQLIGAVTSDVEQPLDILRQTALFVKDLSGVAVTAADLPFQIQKDYASSIKQSLNIAQDSIKSANSDDNVRQALVAVAASVQLNEGLTFNNVADGQLGNASIQAQSIDPANNIFSNPQANFEIFDQVTVSSLSLTTNQQNTVYQIIDDSKNTTVDDLRTYRSKIQNLALQLSNYFGAGNSYYNTTYGRPAPSTRLQPMTLDEYEILNSLYQVMQSYDTLTATTQVDDLNKQTNLEFVAGLAQTADINFNISNSKIQAPVPFGLTIEQIASRYLKDPQRWIEIATLNNLREPYIDENGFQNPILSNGFNRTITIDNINNLYEGQKVTLKSSTQLATVRTILDIKRLSDTSFLITLDGQPNLDAFTTADGAQLQAYLPGTVNSQQKIFIPSTLPVSDDPNIIIPGSTANDPLTGLSKVDILLTDYGDVALNNYGDFRFSYGITNIIQALKIKFGTQKGTNLLHPDFGLTLVPGVSTAEVNLKDTYAAINQMISQDPRFDGVQDLELELNGSTLTVNLSVKIAGQRGVYPIRFQLGN